MSHEDQRQQWSTLDKDLNRISQLELATSYASRPLVAPGFVTALHT